MPEEHQHCPNYSLRLTNLAAVLVLGQIPLLQHKIQLFNTHYDILAQRLGRVDTVGRVATLSTTRG